MVSNLLIEGTGILSVPFPRPNFVKINNQKTNNQESTKIMVTPKSGLFLAGACIMGIAAVGSVFELSSGNPELGSLTTGIILALSIPLTGILFYAAVVDAKANQ